MIQRFYYIILYKAGAESPSNITRIYRWQRRSAMVPMVDAQWPAGSRSTRYNFPLGIKIVQYVACFNLTRIPSTMILYKFANVLYDFVLKPFYCLCTFW